MQQCKVISETPLIVLFLSCWVEGRVWNEWSPTRLSSIRFEFETYILQLEFDSFKVQKQLNLSQSIKFIWFMNQIQQVNCPIKFQIMFELSRFIVSSNNIDKNKYSTLTLKMTWTNICALSVKSLKLPLSMTYELWLETSHKS